MEFYDLVVHSTQSVGENSTEDMINMAERLGFSGIGISKFFTTRSDLNWELPETKLDMIKTIILKSKTPDELKTMANEARKKAEIICVHGGDYEINRAACEESMIDILLHPELGRTDSGIDHICAKAAAENNVAVEVDFREIMESSYKHRVSALAYIKQNIEICNKYGVPIIISSNAHSKWNLRTGRDMAAIGYLLGMELANAIDSVSSVPLKIITENRKKLAGLKWQGVEIIDKP
ncbi:MAG: hypothetical protein J4473_01155 [Candidatus Aenigmarchaeota archaeon]|nr:hypothetical protein [Candidatus Aenigmarchaeota archaeon]